ncbi:MAG: hypothetical protein KAS87_06680, partial [Candidatus Omnitrophica bacterium]|nr:hypothetical protein [Candidatus Omnitrophota bacterium]
LHREAVYHLSRELFLPPSSSFLIGLYEFFNTSIIRFFDIIREEAGRELPYLPMIVNTFAANAFFTARFISAVAFLLILLNITFFHNVFPKVFV